MNRHLLYFYYKQNTTLGTAKVSEKWEPLYISRKLPAALHLFDEIVSSWDMCHEIMNYQKLGEK